MSQNYTNESTLVLFPNDKEGNPKRPDYKGKLYLNGEEFKLSAWIQERKDGSGQKYLKGKIERAGDYNAASTPRPPAPAPAIPAPVLAKPSADQDVPF